MLRNAIVLRPLCRSTLRPVCRLSQPVTHRRTFAEKTTSLQEAKTEREGGSGVKTYSSSPSSSGPKPIPPARKASDTVSTRVLWFLFGAVVTGAVGGLQLRADLHDAARGVSNNVTDLHKDIEKKNRMLKSEVATLRKRIEFMESSMFPKEAEEETQAEEEASS